MDQTRSAVASFRIVPYEPRLWDSLLAAVSQFPPYSVLRHRSFVDYYYGRSERCRLFLALNGQGSVVGTQGVEWMRFRDGEAVYRVGAASGFYSLWKGAGAYLMSAWLAGCDAGLAFGVTEDVRRMISRMRWSFVPGIRTYCVNVVYNKGYREPPLRFLAKMILNRLVVRQPLVSLADRLHRNLADVTVREETAYAEDLLAFRSAFAFRFAPDLAHLNWRYSLELPFVRYRLFRILRDRTTIGYVILQDMPQGITVSHSDGSDPAGLAAGTVRSIVALATHSQDRRMVTLVACHPVMQQVFESVNFRDRPRRRKPLTLGTFRGVFPVSAPVPEWLVNLDWGDRGLRRPFLDEAGGVGGSSSGQAGPEPTVGG